MLSNTCMDSSVIISTILCMILIANLIAARLPKLPLGVIGACLIGSCVGLYFFDLAQLASLPKALKIVAVGALTTLPMLFSGIIFIRSFSIVEQKSAALGANLIGSLVGGMLQSLTFITGIKALLLVVAAIYLAALVYRPVTPPRTLNLDDDDEEDANLFGALSTKVGTEGTLEEPVGA